MKREIKLSATHIIIGINIGVYLWMILLTNPQLTYTLYALNSPFTNPFITYFTSAFLHGSIMHLLFNMYFLFIMGPILEKYLGTAKFVAYYLLCALLSGFLTSMFATGLVIGASGVLFAIITTCITLDKSDLPDFKIYNSRGLINVLLLNVVITFIVPTISIEGHLSGIVTGLIAALVIMTMKERR